MKKILTLAIVAIFAASFANASTLTTGMGVKAIVVKATSSKSTHAKYVKISSKEFSIKKMQDTKDTLMPVGGSNSNIADFLTTKAS